jgi:hypothetical protein
METKIEEIWKDVVGYEGLYKVSSFGSICSLVRSNQYPNGTILKGILLNIGYLMVNLYKNKSVKCHHVHRLVALSYIPNPDDKKQVNHIDGNPLNNNIENLEWVSHRENMRHWMKNSVLGDRLMNKERIDKVLYLRNMGYTQYAIAWILKVNQSVISRVLSGKDEWYQSIVEGENIKYL